jgi:hypothetical protein
MTGLVVISPDAIPEVICPGSDYTSAGSAFRVGPDGLLLSVNHVTSDHNCAIDGKPINIAYASRTEDFSELLGDEGPYLQIDCGGFVKDRRYIAFGHARGLPEVASVDLVATGLHAPNGQALLSGILAVIPGQSGGPIVSADTGKVVGVVNAENYEEGLSWSLELKDTPVCRHAASSIRQESEYRPISQEATRA